MLKPIGIIGYGLSGKAAHRLLKLIGLQPSEIFTFDDKAGVADFSDHKQFLSHSKCGTLVVSPGYPLESAWLKSFQADGGVVTSELALAYELLRSHPNGSLEHVIGITGSVGKSTVTALIGAGFLSGHIPAFVGGNFGFPLADYVADIYEGKRARAEWLVLELSSFQLENAGTLECDYSILTYLGPNHMERYTSLESYYGTKWSLLSRTKKKGFLNLNGADLEKFASDRISAAIEPIPEIVWVSRDQQILSKADYQHAKLLGTHNRDNLALAAAVLSEVFRKNFEAAKTGLIQFPGLSHRLENMGTFHGARFINDSKATTMDSVKTAIQGLRDGEHGTIHVLLGGRDKNLPWQELGLFAKAADLRFSFFGESSALIPQKSGLTGSSYPKLRDAVAALEPIVKTGDLVLLSPGGTSLDEFKNFEERGKLFRSYVEEIFI